MTLVKSSGATAADEFAAKLPACRSIEEVLAALKLIATEYGLAAIRYYKFFDGFSQLVSIDCVGHDEKIRGRIRQGRIAHNATHEQRPSFAALQLKKPVCIQIDRDLRESVKYLPGDEYSLMIIMIRHDECGQVLDEIRPPNNFWIDLPLIVNDRVVGKLSCDLKSGVSPGSEAIRSDIYSFWRYAQLSAAYLECIASWDYLTPLQTALIQITTARTFADLYKYCTHKLISLPPFQFDYASIYVTSSDVRNSRRLILRATSDRNLAPQVGRICFKPDDIGVVPWVWRHKRAVRLNLSSDSQAVRSSSQDYSDLVVRPQVHFKPADVLAVPIGSELNNDLVGVLLFARDSAKAPIEPRDEWLLQKIVDSGLGARMLSLEDDEFAHQIRDHLVEINLGMIEDASKAVNISETIRNALEPFFREEQSEYSSKKLFTICLANEERRQLKAIVLGGTMGTDLQKDAVYPLANTLTEYAIRLYRTTKQPYLFINDLETAEYFQVYRRNEHGARCVIASVIAHHNEVYGVLMIFSDSYDLLPVQAGKLITCLASQIGHLIARRHIIEYSSLIVALRHDCNTPLLVIGELLKGVLNDSARVIRQAIQHKLNFISDAIDVHCRRGSTEAKFFCQQCRPVEVSALVRKAASQAISEATNLDAHDLLSDNHIDRLLVAEVFPQSLVAYVQPSFVKIILFNLFRNAWQIDSSQTVRISAQQIHGTLQLRIANHCSTEHQRRIELALSNDLPGPLYLLWYERETHAKGSGIRLVKRLLDWHRVPAPDGLGERAGTINCSFPDATSVEFLVHIPEVPFNYQMNGGDRNVPLSSYPAADR